MDRRRSYYNIPVKIGQMLLQRKDEAAQETYSQITRQQHTLNPQPSTFISQPSTINQQPSTIHV
jgi:hypothetical protein